MGFNIAKTAEKTIDLSFDYEGENIEIKVKPNVMTPAFGKQLEQSDLTSSHESAVTLVKTAVVDWNLDWNGEPFPPTPENIANCPYGFLTKILTKLTEVWAGNAPKSSS